jgi:NAD(P)H-hydrate repair Nnr-like enzyme with NAD(P)H-hydrate dehydratase domain
VIASAGNKTKIDTIGGAELSTAGSGDILAGLIGSMLASWRPVDSHAAHDVICGAVELHSLAGRRAAKEFTSVSAIEILESLRHI